jgi:flagellin-like protein
MKAMKKDLAGVSPVIAVILMVAITVVLAGVVFLWAQSFTEDAGGGAKTLSVDLDLEATVAPAGELTITPLKGDVDWGDYELYFNGAILNTTGLTTSVGEDEVIAVTGLTIGNEFNVRIVDIEDQTVLVNTNVMCKA